LSSIEVFGETLDCPRPAKKAFKDLLTAMGLKGLLGT
jgi:hypothetical protein